jgi:hypothetical protein
MFEGAEQRPLPDCFLCRADYSQANRIAQILVSTEAGLADLSALLVSREEFLDIHALRLEGPERVNGHASGVGQSIPSGFLE